MNRIFANIANWIARVSGTSYTFIIACCVFITWGVSGPFFQYSDTWQLVANTATSLSTFLMVFLLQNTQIRDSTAMQVKLDELIRVSLQARNSLIDLEDSTDEEIAIQKKHVQESACDV